MKLFLGHFFDQATDEATDEAIFGPFFVLETDQASDEASGDRDLGSSK